MKRIYAALLGFGLLAAAASSAWSQSPEQQGYDIAKAASDQNNGFKDYSATGKMTLRNAAGAEAVRNFDYKSLESSGGDKSLLVFSWPGDIRDTGLLTYKNETGDDSQWIYLPADRRVKRIAGSSRSGSFVGSEFAYEDMVEQDLGAFSYKWLRDEGCCSVVERVPKSSSNYSKQIVWFDKSNNTITKVEYYNRGGVLLKVLTVSGYKKYNGKFWRPTTMVMSNRQTGKETTLSWSDHRFGVGLDDDSFTTRALERGG